MTIKEYCGTCDHESNFKAVECGTCEAKYYNGVMQGEPSNYKSKPMTNGDRIRAMSDDELADFLCSILTAECCDRSCPARDMCDYGYMGLIKWLKLPPKEEE